MNKREVIVEFMDWLVDQNNIDDLTTNEAVTNYLQIKKRCAECGNSITLYRENKPICLYCND